jgi:hypothetical protein
MVYAYTQDVPVDEDRYHQIIANIGPDPVAGSLLHLCIRQPDGSLRYIDVWESEQACADAFEQRIHAAVDAAFGGRRPSTEPEVHRLDVLHASGAAIDGTAELLH